MRAFAFLILYKKKCSSIFYNIQKSSLIIQRNSVELFVSNLYDVMSTVVSRSLKNDPPKKKEPHNPFNKYKLPLIMFLIFWHAYECCAERNLSIVYYTIHLTHHVLVKSQGEVFKTNNLYSDVKFSDFFKYIFVRLCT